MSYGTLHILVYAFNCHIYSMSHIDLSFCSSLIGIFTCNNKKFRAHELVYVSPFPVPHHLIYPPTPYLFFPAVNHSSLSVFQEKKNFQHTFHSHNKLEKHQQYICICFSLTTLYCLFCETKKNPKVVFTRFLFFSN